MLDIEVGRPHDSQPELFMIGILWWDEHGKETVEIIDRNRVRLAEVIDWIRREDRTIVTYAGTGYDIPMLSALLAGDLPAYTASQVAIEAK